MMHAKPEFPEDTIWLVQKFAAAHTYPDVTRAEAIALIEDCVADMIARKQVGLGEAHIAIVNRVNARGPDFIVFPDAPSLQGGALVHEGAIYAAPRRKSRLGRPRLRAA